MPVHVDVPAASGVLVPTWLESAIRATESVVGAAVVAGAVVVVATDVADGVVVAGAEVDDATVVAGSEGADGADVVGGVVVADVAGVVVVVAPDPDVELGTLIGAPESVGSARTACGPNATGLLALPAVLETATVPAVEPAGSVAVTCV